VPQAKPALRTVPGGRTQPQAQGFKALAPLFKTVLATGTATVMLLTAICCGRIFLVNLTVEAAAEADSLSSAIEQARSNSIELEKEHALATNPARIQEAAAKLGMVPDTDIQTLTATSSLTPQAISALDELAAQALAAEEAARQAQAEQLAAHQRAAEAAAAKEAAAAAQADAAATEDGSGVSADAGAEEAGTDEPPPEDSDAQT